MKTKYVLSSATLLLGSMLLGGCGIAPTTMPDGSVAFPARSSAWLKEGAFVNVESLRQVKPGLTKKQVYALIAEPHFNEGVFAVHVWNYVFDFGIPEGKVVSCQYRVQFDRDMKVKATYWKEPECAALLDVEAARPMAGS